MDLDDDEYNVSSGYYDICYNDICYNDKCYDKYEAMSLSNQYHPTPVFFDNPPSQYHLCSNEHCGSSTPATSLYQPTSRNIYESNWPSSDQYYHHAPSDESGNKRKRL